MIICTGNCSPLENIDDKTFANCLSSCDAEIKNCIENVIQTPKQCARSVKRKLSLIKLDYLTENNFI
ncbi:hypothetical protein FQR65_LT08271 [Abscondita terminalis]|nr:hypothetical protein FQR65_LT08271 [Abscondita terminalis]